MKKCLPFLFTLCLLSLTACFLNDSETRPTPTPFATATAVSEETAGTGGRPVPVAMADLANTPEIFEDAFIQITGQYQRLPLLVCEHNPYPSPVTWALVTEDGTSVAVKGFGPQLRNLVPERLTMTVAGLWQQWRGPVGCGKQATIRQIWYLKASDIISPSPIVQVTLTPTGMGGVTQVSDADATAAAIEPGGTPAPTTPGTGDVPTSTPGGNSFPTATPTLGAGIPPTATSPSSFTPAPSITPANGNPVTTPTTSAGTPTATATSSGNGSGTGTPVPTAISTSTPGGGGGSSTPTATVSSLATATADSDSFTQVEWGELLSTDVHSNEFGTQETHVFPIGHVPFDSTDILTVTAIVEPGVNLVLRVLDGAKTSLVEANDNGAGGGERIDKLTLDFSADSYYIEVFAQDGSAGNYCLTYYAYDDGFGLPTEVKGRINYGQSVTGQLTDPLGEDIWCFMGTVDDSVSISITGAGSSQPSAIICEPPDCSEVITFDGDPPVSLPDSGMFMIIMFENSSQPDSYTLTLTRN